MSPVAAAAAAAAPAADAAADAPAAAPAPAAAAAPASNVQSDKVLNAREATRHTNNSISCWILQRQEDPITVYMGVPTMYSYLLSKYDAASQQDQQEARWGFRTQHAQGLLMYLCVCLADLFSVWLRGAYTRQSFMYSKSACSYIYSFVWLSRAHHVQPPALQL